MHLLGIPQIARNNLQITAKNLGTIGELTLARQLQNCGMTTIHQPGKLRGDILAKFGNTETTLEVKTAFRDKRGKFNFCLYRKVGGRVCTDCHNADLVALLCVENDYRITALILPSSVMTGTTLSFKNPQTCKYSQYIVWF